MDEEVPLLVVLDERLHRLVGFAWGEGWPIIDWERGRLVAPARPPTGFPRPFLLLWTRHWWQHLLRDLIFSKLILVRPI